MIRTKKLCLITVLLLIVAFSAYFYFNKWDSSQSVFEGTLVDTKDNIRKANGEIKRACRKAERKVERGIDKMSGYAERKINRMYM